MSNVTPYNPTDWKNKPNTSSPINAVNLNKIEQGIKAVTDFANTLSDVSVSVDNEILVFTPHGEE